MVETQKSPKRRVRNDIIFIVATLVILGVVAICLFVFSGNGNTVTVTVNGEVYAVYPLSENRTEDIVTGDGQLNRLVILDGEAFIEVATCPDGICSGHKPISRNNESIACLPHRVVVTVTTTESNLDDSPDIVT